MTTSLAYTEILSKGEMEAKFRNNPSSAALVTIVERVSMATTNNMGDVGSPVSNLFHDIYGPPTLHLP
jgi:hypothetical protein